MISEWRQTYSGVALRQLAEVDAAFYNVATYEVYALYNKKHNRIYIGQTKNLEERICIHKEKIFSGYTSRFDGEWVLIYKETLPDRLSALKREKQLKSFRGREFIKKNIPA